MILAFNLIAYRPDMRNESGRRSRGRHIPLPRPEYPCNFPESEEKVFRTAPPSVDRWDLLFEKFYGLINPIALSKLSHCFCLSCRVFKTVNSAFGCRLTNPYRSQLSNSAWQNCTCSTGWPVRTVRLHFRSWVKKTVQKNENLTMNNKALSISVGVLAPIPTIGALRLDLIWVAADEAAWIQTVRPSGISRTVECCSEI